MDRTAMTPEKGSNEKHMGPDRYRTGVVVVAVYLFLMLFYRFASASAVNEEGMLFGFNFNYLAYLFSLIGAMAAGFAAYGISLKRRSASKINGSRAEGAEEKVFICLYALFMLSLTVWVYLIYRDETNMLSGDTLPDRFLRERAGSKEVWFAGSLLVSIIVFMLIQGRMEQRTHSKKIRLAISGAAIILCSLLAFSPNPYLTNHGVGGMYNVDAYVNSIINAAHGVPYSDRATSIYGHYGLVYLPFVKILGNSTFSVMLTIALFTALLIAAAAYISDYLIDSDMIFLITIAAVAGIGTTYYGAGQYNQIYPHRVLFPVLAVALLVKNEKAKISRPAAIVIAVLFGITACVFNLETGMCAVMTIAAYVFFGIRTGSLAKAVLKYAGIVMYPVVSFLGAYGAVNIYNLLAGGQVNSVKTFIFPIGSDVYDMFSILRAPLPGETGGFLLHIVVYVTVAIICMVSLFTSPAKDDDPDKGKTLTGLCLAVCGMGVLIYFMDRPVPTCLAISHVQFLICLGYLCRLCADKRMAGVSLKAERFFNRGAFCVISLLIIYFALEGVVSAGDAVRQRSNTVWNVSSYKECMETVRAEIPENTLGIGVGELYYSLGWDNMVCTMDYADNNKYGVEAMESAAAGADTVLVNREVTRHDRLTVLRKQFHVIKEVETPEIYLMLYERNDSE